MLFQVEMPGSVESSVWHVLAQSPLQAAHIYLREAEKEHIAIDLDELDASNVLLVREIPGFSLEPRLIPWEECPPFPVDINAARQLRDSSPDDMEPS